MVMDPHHTRTLDMPDGSQAVVLMTEPDAGLSDAEFLKTHPAAAAVLERWAAEENGG
jgi:hypothetical protein